MHGTTIVAPQSDCTIPVDCILSTCNVPCIRYYANQSIDIHVHHAMDEWELQISNVFLLPFFRVISPQHRQVCFLLKLKTLPCCLISFSTHVHTGYGIERVCHARHILSCADRLEGMLCCTFITCLLLHLDLALGNLYKESLRSRQG